MSQTSPEIERAASLAEDLIQAAVDYERSEGIYAKGCRQELSEARAAVEAAILGHAQCLQEPRMAALEHTLDRIATEYPVNHGSKFCKNLAEAALKWHRNVLDTSTDRTSK